ncbi:MAG: carboxylesterase family protein [Thermodesulfobacteriota bacterium]|nr:carboxylesterase family protein [Thermodesulfobacteriota bacterium]
MNVMLKKYSLLVLVLLVLTSCRISGTVTRDGEGIQGATVVLSNGQEQRTTQTDRTGAYEFTEIPKGIYTVTLLPIPGFSGKAEQRVFKSLDDVDETGVDFSMDSTTIRTISTGKIIGKRDENGIATWQGIPYAAPPVDELRWKAPVAPEPWGDNPYMAVATGSPGLQYLDMMNDPPVKFYGQTMGSENCLYLNVWAPETPGKKPVMFWIHGGGESVGEGGIYNGRELAERHNVVVVTFNYRLGPFGWFSHPLLNVDGSAEDQSGNFGTLDIIFALKWVQQNIGAFGGDRDNVMVFGESAGGLNTMTMLASPLASGLFHKAAIQSGVFGWIAEHTAWCTRDMAENYMDAPSPGLTRSSAEVVNTLLIQQGLAHDRASARTIQDAMTPAEFKTFLMGLSSADILAAYDYEDTLGGILMKPAVIRDGTVIPDMAPLPLFESGQYNQVPVIVGTNRDEYKLFMMMMPEYVNNVAETVPLVQNKNDYALSAHYYSEAWKALAGDALSTALAVNQPDAVYTYRFDWDEEPNLMVVDVSFVIGAAHGMEIPYVFADPDFSVVQSKEAVLYTRGNEAGRDALARSMSSYWAALAWYGAPGNGMPDYPQAVTWTPWNTAAGNDRLMIFDTPESGGPVMSDYMVTLDEVKAQLQAEDGYEDPGLKCDVYTDIFSEDGDHADICEY